MKQQLIAALVLCAAGAVTCQAHLPAVLHLTFDAILDQTIIQTGAGALPEQHTSFRLASSTLHQALWQQTALQDGRNSETLQRFNQHDQFYSEPFFNETVCFQFSSPPSNQNATQAWSDAILRLLGLYQGVLTSAKSAGTATVNGVACSAWEYQLGDTKPGDTLVTYWFCVDRNHIPIAINLTNYIKSDGTELRATATTPFYYKSVQSTILKMKTLTPDAALFQAPQQNCVDLTTGGSASDTSLVNNEQRIVDANAAAAGGWYGRPSRAFDGLTIADARMQRLGTRIQPVRLPLLQSELTATTIPDHFDARDNWPNCESIGRIGDQANCGSCWAWAATEVFADRMCIARSELNFTGSVEYMIDCDQDNDSCGGGLIDDAWNFLVNTGVPSASCDPYTAANGTGQTSCPARCADNSELRRFKAVSGYAVGAPGDVRAMQSEILQRGPIQVAFYVFSDFMTYSNGTYFRTKAATGPQGGHSVKIIGWGVDEHGTDYWRVVNSWNSDWGEDGTFRIRRGTNECGIETTPVAGLVSL